MPSQQGPQSGRGIALARGRLAEESLRGGTLLRPFGDRVLDLGTAYWIIVDPDRSHRSRVQAVVDWLFQIAADRAT